MVSRADSRMAASQSARRSSLTIIFTTVFVDLLGFGIVLPLLPYYARQFQASGMAVGALIAVYSAMQFVAAPWWGRLSDRVGRRPVLLVSLAGSTLSYLLFALANNVEWLFVSRMLAGLAGANISVAQAFIADTTSTEERARGMGMIGAAFGLGFVFGPVIGGLLAHYGHAAPGFAATIICGLNFVAAVFRLPESLPPERRHARPAMHPLAQLRDALRRPQLRLPLLIFAAVVFSFATMETTLSLLCASRFHLTASQIYWLFGYLGLMTTLVQGGLIRQLTPRIDEPHLVVIGAALLAVGLGATPFTPPVVPLLLALGAVALGQGISSPVLSSLISKSSRAARARRRARRLAVGGQPRPHPRTASGVGGLSICGTRRPVRHHGALDAGAVCRRSGARAARARSGAVVRRVDSRACRTAEEFLLSSRRRMDALEESLRKLPPQSIEAEESVLGGVLLDNAALDRAIELIIARRFLSRGAPQDHARHDRPESAQRAGGPGDAHRGAARRAASCRTSAAPPTSPSWPSKCPPPPTSPTTRAS